MKSRGHPVCGRLGTRQQVDKHIATLRSAGCVTLIDKEAGTVEARDGDTIVFRALEKQRGGPWICMFFESEGIKWTNDRDRNTIPADPR